MVTFGARPIPEELQARYRAEGWWTDQTLAAVVAESLAAAPQQAINVWSHDAGWRGTYAEIDDEARRLVAVLGAAGIRPGDTVAFQMPNCREAIAAFYGLALGGFVLVPIVHIYGRKEVGFILRESGAVAYLSAPSFGHVDYVQIVDDEAAELRDLRLHLVSGEGELDAPPGIERIRWSALDDVTPAAEITASDPESPVVIAYTSGTTSAPKGVVHTHRTLLAELLHMSTMMTPGQSNLMGSPVTHATGMLGAVLAPVQAGLPINLIDRWDPEQVLDIVLEEGVSAGVGASYFLTSLMEHPNFTPAHAAQMRRVGLGGAPVPPSVGTTAATHGITIIRAYGSTEHPSITGGDWNDPEAKRHLTDGRARVGVEMRIVDEDGHDLAPGQAGEILSRGPDLCAGYTDPVLTAAAFDADGWYRTGDMGVLDDDGYLTITDRLKDIIIRGGENISAAEIEEIIATVPGVAEVAVVAAPDARLGEHACAVIRLLPGTDDLTLGDLRTHLDAAEVARQKWPEEVRLVADFPRTATGKIRKVDLRRAIVEADHDTPEHG